MALRLCEVLRARSKLSTLGDLATLAGLPPLTSNVAARTDPHLDLARAKAGVTVVYKRGERAVTLKGHVECVVKEQEAAYLTLRLHNGRRLLLRLDRVTAIDVAEVSSPM